MDTLVCRFDDTEAFPLLETVSTARGSVTVQTGEQNGDGCLRIALSRQPQDPLAIKAVLVLPPVAVDGKPQEWMLDVLGDASGCCVLLEAGDARGWGFAYSFGSIDFSGRRTCAAQVQQPIEYWGARKEDGTSGVVPPVQPFRLAIVLERRCHRVDINLFALHVTGEARLLRPGIAAGFGLT